MIVNEKAPSSQEEEESQNPIMEEAPEEPPLVGICGEITEESTQQVLQALITYNGGRLINTNKEEFKDAEDIQFFITSGGGAVNAMFAVHDLMQLVKKNRDIATFGYGKVDSAAVLLLASGTPGKRHISRNTRVMLHHCSADIGGTHASIRSSFKELKKLEAKMIQEISDYSNLDVSEIYELFSTNTDKYFSAKQALEMGLVDKII